MILVYYSPDLDQFTTHRECGTVFTLPSELPHGFKSGKRWVAVNESGIEYMSNTIERAMSNPAIDTDKLSSAITGFYRARRCLETEGRSEGFPCLLAMPWDCDRPGLGVFFGKKS